MPFFVAEEFAGQIENAAADTGFVGELEMVSRNCKLEDITDIVIKKMPSFNISDEMIAYASPDSTYAVTRKLLDLAQRSVLIGIYDFSSAYIKQILLNLMDRGVKVSLMLDLDGAKGENAVFEELGKFGAEVVPAPSCSSKKVNYFSSSHEKVIVIDDMWVMVQSGNYSNNSIPFNETDGGNPANFVKGNRDMGIAIKSPELAKFFTKVLRSDMNLELSGPESLTESSPIEFPMVVEAVPKLLPEKLFKSKKFTPSAPVKVTPVLSPDNYMKVVPSFLRSAKKSIYIEQQYIRSKQSDIIKLLDSIKLAVSKNKVEVKIVLGKIFDKKDIPKEKENLTKLEDDFGLQLSKNVRYIDTKRFVHCHNKLIIIDNEKVLISSQNWSNSAVSKNREAGLILEYPELSKYYSKIFLSDWRTAVDTLPGDGEPETVEAAELSGGGFLEVSIGDYAEV